jgi:hypothetical protein
MLAVASMAAAKSVSQCPGYGWHLERSEESSFLGHQSLNSNENVRERPGRPADIGRGSELARRHD